VPSTASLDLTQPLLRGGGRAVTLEPLTQFERDLLYSVRAFARFRKVLHVAIAGGGDFSTSFPDGGFVLQRLGLSGLAPTIGYLPTLLSAAFVTNQQNNVSELERIITFYHQLQGGGDVSPLQTAQVESQLLNSRSTLLQREQSLRDNLDQFKFQICRWNWTKGRFARYRGNYRNCETCTSRTALCSWNRSRWPMPTQLMCVKCFVND
jgi:hypothetical protein